MSRGIKIGIIVAGIVVVLPILGVVALFVGVSLFNKESQIVLWREIPLANHGTLIIDGDRRDRSEHGFSQRAGYRPPGSDEIEWFGDVSDGVEPQVYQAGPLLVVIDPPSACLFVRTSKSQEKWKNLALVFPNDLGPFPISFYAERSGLTMEEVSRINELGGKRERKYPTTYIQSFDPETRDLKCSYHVDNKASWPLHLRLSEDGTRLALVGIGGSSP
ncbi:MAG TPA: hypothetical protein VNX27_03635 [Chthoniobacterales bacterium]|jgi:hypothetical protein|nr:hypothetical protein [Chthoniobacterales bacterium]